MARAQQPRTADEGTTWGDLGDEHVGRTVTWQWPWGEDAAGVLVERGNVSGYEEDGTELRTHRIDYGTVDGQDVGQQPTQRPVTWPVVVL